MAAEKKIIKTPKGSFSCSGDSLAWVIEEAIRRGISVKDFDKVTFEHDWSGCYYPDDTPSISVEWENIYEKQ